MTGKPTDADDWALGTVDEYEGHLEEDFELVGDGFGSAIGEGFGAIAAVEQESAALLGVGDEGFEAFDFPACDQWGECVELCDSAIDCFAVWIDDLLGLEFGFPGLG